MEKIPKFDKRSSFNKAVGPGKNPKLINVGDTSIQETRVHLQSKFGPKADLQLSLP